MKHELMLDDVTKLSLKSGFGGKLHVFINDQKQPFAKDGYRVLLGGQEKLLTVSRGAFSGTPKVVLDGRDLQIARPLKAYEWVLCGLPLLLVLTGGALGGLCGALAMALNMKMFRSDMHAAAKIVLSLVVGGAAFVLFMIIAVTLKLLIDGGL